MYGVNSDPTGFGVFGRNSKNDTIGHLGGPDAGAYGIHGPSKNEGTLGHAEGGVVGRHGSAGTAGALGAFAAGVMALGSAAHPALEVVGAAMFVRSGVATVRKGKSSIKVDGWKANGAAEVAVAVPVVYRAGVGVAATVVDGTAGTVTIYLTKAVSADTKVAFFLFGGPHLT